MSYPPPPPQQYSPYPGPPQGAPQQPQQQAQPGPSGGQPPQQQGPQQSQPVQQQAPPPPPSQHPQSQPPPPQGQPPPQPQYQAYPPYPPQPQPIPQPYPQYAPAHYSYPPPDPYYYPPYVNGYAYSYPGPPQPYPPSYPRPGYPAGPSNYPQAQPHWNGQPHQQNGFGYLPPPPQTRPYRQPTPAKNNSPESNKRRRTELRPIQPPPPTLKVPNPVQTPPKEKKTFSDFRVSRIRIGNFDSDERKTETDTRDSRLRFYFRSGASEGSDGPSENAPPADVAAQASDRISVSLHKGSRRIVIPSEHLLNVQFNRTDGYVKIEGDGWVAFEEIRPEDNEETASTSNVDPTNGEWAKCKIMEIWLDKNQSLTEPKWTRGDLRRNIDPSSKFQNLIHIVDAVAPPPQQPPSFATFEAFTENWRDRSAVGTIEARTGFLVDFASERLVDLIERCVSQMCFPLAATVERLFSIMKDKENLQVELKQIVLGIPYPFPPRALDAMLADDISQHRESTHSGMSSLSNHIPAKRPREDDEMDISSDGKHEPTIPEEPIPANPGKTRSPSAMKDVTPVPVRDGPAKNGSHTPPDEDTETKAKTEEDPHEIYKFIQTPAGLMQTPAHFPFTQEQAQAVYSPRDLAGADIGEDFSLEEINEEDLEKTAS